LIFQFYGIWRHLHFDKDRIEQIRREARVPIFIGINFQAASCGYSFKK
jgi:hypothetical protein